MALLTFGTIFGYLAVFSNPNMFLQILHHSDVPVSTKYVFHSNNHTEATVVLAPIDTIFGASTLYTHLDLCLIF